MRQRFKSSQKETLYQLRAEFFPDKVKASIGQVFPNSTTNSNKQFKVGYQYER